MRVSSKVFWLTGVLAFSACTRQTRSPLQEQSLEGLRLRLEPEGFSASGQVGSKTASVRFDVLRPLSAVSRDCFVFPPEDAGIVRVPGFEVRERDVPMVWVDDASVEGRFLGKRRMEGVASGARCELILGIDLLMPYAFQIDSVVKQVQVTTSAPRVSTPEGYVSWPVTKEPRSDMPLIAVLLHAEGRQIPLTLGLSTAGVSEIARAWATQEEPLALELLPGVWVNEVSFPPIESLPDGRFDGKLGADVYGRFNGLLDIKAGVFWLKVDAAAPRKPAKLPSVPRAKEPNEPD